MASKMLFCFMVLVYNLYLIHMTSVSNGDDPYLIHMTSVSNGDDPYLIHMTSTSDGNDYLYLIHSASNGDNPYTFFLSTWYVVTLVILFTCWGFPLLRNQLSQLSRIM